MGSGIIVEGNMFMSRNSHQRKRGITKYKIMENKTNKLIMVINKTFPTCSKTNP